MKKTVLAIILLMAVSVILISCNGVSVGINFYVDGELYDGISTEGGETIEMPDNPEKEGYVFQGWFWDEGTWTQPFTASSLLNQPVSEALSVYAYFISEAELAATRLVTFETMGAGAVNHVVITDQTGNITSAATIDAAKVSGLANVAKTGAYGDLTGTPSLGTLASKSTITSGDITDGTISEADLNTTINASLDKADSALQESDIADMQTTTNLTNAAGWDTDKSSDTKYPSNAAVNAAITDATSGLATDSKMGNLSTLTTTEKTNLVGAINEVDANADAAKAAADAAQADATQAISDAAEAQAAAEAKIPLPDGECSNPTAKCVLVSNGTNSFEWEVIARGTSEAGAQQ